MLLLNTQSAVHERRDRSVCWIPDFKTGESSRLTLGDDHRKMGDARLKLQTYIIRLSKLTWSLREYEMD